MSEFAHKNPKLINVETCVIYIYYITKAICYNNIVFSAMTLHR